jgi:NDP-sugar pyrophosphorylase family protein
MKAMILAAGLGTRLKPLTDDKPKALIDIGGYTMLELAIRYLCKYGVDEIIINLHHYPDQIIQYLAFKNNFGIKINFSDERTALLNTGGAIKHASWYLKGEYPFLLMAVDVITDLDIHEMMRYHELNKPLVTLAVKDRITSRSLLFNKEMQLVGWKNNQANEQKGKSIRDADCALGFSGIHIIDPAIFDLIEEEGSFSIIDLYLRLMESQRIAGFRHDQSKWIEFGRIESLQQIVAGDDFKYLINVSSI